jgi:hypothetical protein
VADTSFTDFIQGLSKAPEDLIIKISQQLKDANLYKGKITNKFDINLYNALILANQKYLGEAKFASLYNQTMQSPIDFLERIGIDGASEGAAGAPKTIVQTYVTSVSQTARILDTVAQDLLGRKLNKAEKRKYTELINQQQRKQPAVQTSGKGFTSTRGGVDEQQFIAEKIGATAEAKTNRAADAYGIMLEELGGLR